MINADGSNAELYYLSVDQNETTNLADKNPKVKPKDSRPVAHTRLMGMARVVLVAVLIVAFMAFRAHSGG